MSPFAAVPVPGGVPFGAEPVAPPGAWSLLAAARGGAAAGAALTGLRLPAGRLTA
ncbi:hypothetical protein LV779_03535 [Streptomyces thinghirensis]|nr:hypothetical protein [Streptomyces thinghirensis]